MKKTIVIAYDGSSFADAAIDDLKRAGLGANVTALLVVVPDRWMVELPEPSDDIPAATRESLVDAQGYARVGAERIATLYPEWHVESIVRPLSPAEAVLGIVEERAADMIVVGSRGRNAVGRLLLGSVSQSLLHNAPCSIRIARTRVSSGDAPPRIIVAIDGGNDSELAITEIASRQWPPGTAIRLIAVVGAPVFPYAPNIGFDLTGWPEGIPVEVRTKLDEFVNKGADRLRQQGLIADAVVREGGVAPAILDDAREWGADAIFIGARGHRLFERILLGSVSATVAAKAECTVEIVRGKGEL